MEVGCVIFCMKHKRRQKKNARDNGLQGLEGFQTAIHPSQFMVRWQRTPVALFCLLHMQNRW
jgi:hypothetical protein